ncbi:tetratricopeptide repeat protein [Tunicatimonas pelagia]|uniref:tetratricopeptide repeat protein n=1 Tax=Tunicatimonas pelagia TaxID=931531 RepID=UPI0026661852|nr:tetratricopeptide repeat protein [Tunicatimonas pelagia]WKN45706.1 tetratricopeptide repeat protein [Tunicatimonas pelagia]
MNALQSISRFFFIVLGCAITLPTVAQVSSEVQQLFYRGYLTTEKAPWEQAIEKINQDTSLDEIEKLHATTEAQTGLLIYAMAHQDEATYDAIADDLEGSLKTILKEDAEDATALAKMAQLYGATMAFQSWRAMYLGPKSQKLVDQALEAEPENADAWVQRANSRLFTPTMFGGDIDEAVECFEKAVQYYEAQPDYAKNWRYLNSLAWLGQAYQKSDQPSKAIATYQKALEVEPSFGWVKYKLMPQVIAQSSNK